MAELTVYPITAKGREAAAVLCLPCDRWPALCLVENAAGIVGLACPDCLRAEPLPGREVVSMEAEQEELFG